jgi:predicted nucleic acid-binding Zn ribbon protein
MDYIDIGNPYTGEIPEFECSVCGKPIEHPGYCSYLCYKTDQM